MKEFEEKLSYKDYQAVIDKIINLLDQYIKDDFLACSLFGSIARGEATSLSDIDLLIIHKKCPKDMAKEFSKIVIKLRETDEYNELLKRGILPEPYPIFLDEGQLKKHPWILLDVTNHGIILRDPYKILEKELKLVQKKLKQLGSYRVILPDKTWYWVLKPDWKPGEIFEL